MRKAVVEGPLAFTELHLYFHNPEDRRREGTFQITLPPARGGVAVRDGERRPEDGGRGRREAARASRVRRLPAPPPGSGAAREGRGQSVHGEGVPDRAEGRQAHRDQLQPGAAGRAYVLPLRGLPKTERVDVALRCAARTASMLEQTLSERDWLPDRDFVVDGSSIRRRRPSRPASSSPRRSSIEHAEVGRADAPTGVTMLVDTSASRALGFAPTCTRSTTLVAELARDYGAELPRRGHRVRPGRRSDLRPVPPAKRSIPTRRCSSATRPVRPISGRRSRGSASTSRSRASSSSTDGVITAGARRRRARCARQEARPASIGSTSCSPAASATSRRRALVARAGSPHAGAVLDLDRGVDRGRASHRPRQSRPTLPIDVAGCELGVPEDASPRRAGRRRDDLRARDAQARAGSTSRSDGDHGDVHAGAGDAAPFVERAVAGAEIDELEAKLAVAPRRTPRRCARTSPRGRSRPRRVEPDRAARARERRRLRALRHRSQRARRRARRRPDGRRAASIGRARRISRCPKARDATAATKEKGKNELGRATGRQGPRRDEGAGGQEPRRSVDRKRPRRSPASTSAGSGAAGDAERTRDDSPRPAPAAASRGRWHRPRPRGRRLRPADASRDGVSMAAIDLPSGQAGPRARSHRARRSG